MKKTFQLSGIAFVAAALCVASAGASSISIDSICVVGSCSDSDVLALGATSSNPFNFNYTFANSDRYLLSGVLSAANLNTGYILAVSDLLVTFEGNNAGKSFAQDVLQADFLQNLKVQRGANGNAYESIGGIFSPDLANASSASGQLLVSGQGLAPLGPYYASTSGTFSGSANGTLLLPAGAPFIDYRYIMTFDEGSQPGAYIGINPTSAVPTPEPGSLVLLSTGLAMMTTVRCRRLFTVAG